MGVTGWQRQEQRHQEDLQRLQGFRPIDDTFMRGLFKENIPLAEFVPVSYTHLTLPTNSRV